MRRRRFLHTVLAGGGLVGWQGLEGRGRGGSADRAARAWTGAAVHAQGREPIIDVHMHAYPAQAAIAASLANPATGKPAWGEGRGGAPAGVSRRDEAPEHRQGRRERRRRRSPGRRLALARRGARPLHRGRRRARLGGHAAARHRRAAQRLCRGPAARAGRDHGAVRRVSRSATRNTRRISRLPRSTTSRWRCTREWGLLASRSIRAVAGSARVLAIPRCSRRPSTATRSSV